MQRLQTTAEKLTQERDQLLLSPLTEYFISVIPEYRTNILQTLLTIQQKNGDPDAIPDRKICINQLSYITYDTRGLDQVYIILTICIAFISVLSLFYMMERRQIQNMNLLRSIGAEKKQLLLLSSIELCLYTIPSLLTGILLGTTGTWLFLRIAVFTDSEPIRLKILTFWLLTALLIWCIGIWLIKMLLLCKSFRIPITSNPKIGGKKLRLSKNLQLCSQIILTAVLCFVFTFAAQQSAEPIQYYKYWSSMPSYTIYKGNAGHTENSFISVDELQTLRSIPGIEKVLGVTELKTNLYFAENHIEKDVYLYVIDDSQWSEVFNIEQTGIDINLFRTGSSIVILFPIGSEEIDSEILGSTVEVHAINSNKDMIEKISVEIGGILEFDYRQQNYGLVGTGTPYTIIASECFFQNILSKLENDTFWEGYVYSTQPQYERAFALTTLNAEYLSTDKATSFVCSQHNLLLDNRREQFAAYAKNYLREGAFFLICGACIAAILLIVLNGLIKLDTANELRKFGILRAIGMSHRQILKSIITQAVLRSAVSFLIGNFIYLIYILIECQKRKSVYLLELGEIYSLKDLFFRDVISLLQNISTNQNCVGIAVFLGPCIVFAITLFHKRILLKAMEV